MNDNMNYNLIKDVEVQLKVRIGTKKMLLKDILQMDIGSIVELEQLAQGPLELLVQDKVIGYGEPIVVDGNFGIKVLEINGI